MKSLQESERQVDLSEKTSDLCKYDWNFLQMIYIVVQMLMHSQMDDIDWRFWDTMECWVAWELKVTHTVVLISMGSEVLDIFSRSDYICIQV